MIAWAGGLLILIAALLLYVATPHQKLMRVPAGRPAAWGGWALLLIGLLLIGQWAGPATTVFIVMAAAMLVWTVVPLGVAWWRAASGDGS